MKDGNTRDRLSSELGGVLSCDHNKMRIQIESSTLEEEIGKCATVEFETGFTPFFQLFKVNRLFLAALVRSWLALLYTLHKLTSPCSCQKWPTSVGYQRQTSISSASDFKLDHKDDIPFSNDLMNSHLQNRLPYPCELELLPRS